MYSNGFSIKSCINCKRYIDCIIYTYVKRNTAERCNWYDECEEEIHTNNNELLERFISVCILAKANNIV